MNHYSPTSLHRRDFFSFASAGIGSVALTGLLMRDGLVSAAPVLGEAGDPCPHLRPRVKRVIHVVATGGVSQARASIEEAQKSIEAANARLTAAQSGVRQVQANATRATRDVERLKGLLAKDEYDCLLG